MMEVLEARLAPATFVNPFTVHYTEPDGDLVEVKSSLPIFEESLRAFQFEPGGDGEKLVSLELGAGAAGGQFKITVIEQGSEGDGSVDVDRITSIVDLGRVQVDGRLGLIEAGDPNVATPALRLLRVESLGFSSPGESETTYAPYSILRGDVIKVQVLHDINGGRLDVTGHSGYGSIGSLEIGGSLIGGAASFSGRVLAFGSIGSVSIQGDIQGGEGSGSGRIAAHHTLHRVEIGGSVLGSAGENSGTILARELGQIIIMGDLEGGSGTYSGAVRSQRGFQQLELFGSIIGGAGVRSGFVNPYFAVTGGTISSGVWPVESIIIHGDLKGGSQAESGMIYLGTAIKDLQILGSVFGGTGDGSGGVLGIDAGSIFVSGDVVGGSGRESGFVNFAAQGGLKREYVESLEIGGSVIGGSGIASGRVLGDYVDKALLRGSVIGGANAAAGSFGVSYSWESFEIGGSIIGGQGVGAGTAGVGINAGTLYVRGDVVGSTGESSGVLYVNGQPGIATGKVVIAGKIIGAEGDFSGSVQGFRLGSIKVGGDIAGGEGKASGSMKAQTIASLTLKGSLIGASGLDSGSVSAFKIGSVRISGDIRGGSAQGLVDDLGVHGSGLVLSTERLKSIEVGGNLSGGDGSFSGAIITGGTLGSAVIRGDVTGGDGSFSGTIRCKSRIETVKIVGSLEGGAGGESGTIFSGFDPEDGKALKASIGTITIRGDIRGGSGNLSAAIEVSKTIERLRIDGSLIGGANYFSGRIAAKIVEFASIGGDIVGSDTGFAGTFYVHRLGSLELNGSVIGGSGIDSGRIFGRKAEKISIGGSVIGGDGFYSGSIQYSKYIHSLVIAGSLRGGDAPQSGWLVAARFGDVTIHGDIEDSKVHGENFDAPQVSGAISGRSAQQIHIGGSVFAAELSSGESARTSYAIAFSERVNTLSIGGGLIGNENNRLGFASGFEIKETPVGFGSIIVSGDAAFAEISAGFRRTPLPFPFPFPFVPPSSNPDARIDKLVVKGDWTASSASAGVQPGNDGYFGTEDDYFAFAQGEPTLAVPVIAKVIIGGSVSGTAAEGDHFGFVAGRVEALSVGGSKVPLKPGQLDLVTLSSSTDDVVLREISEE